MVMRSRVNTKAGHSYQPNPSRDPAKFLGAGNPLTLGIPTRRAERWRKADLDDLKKHYKGQSVRPSAEALDKLWRELKDPAGAIRTLDLARLPADALAFYRQSRGMILTVAARTRAAIIGFR